MVSVFPSEMVKVQSCSGKVVFIVQAIHLNTKYMLTSAGHSGVIP